MMEQECIKVLPLPNDETLSFLRGYNKFLKSILLKKLKSFTDIGGCSDLVSAGSLMKLELTDEVCVLINVIISKLPCYSVYSGILLSGILLKLWSESCHIYDVHSISLALGELRSILDNCLESLKLTQENTDVRHLQSLVVPLLIEEKGICLGADSLDALSRQIVKAVVSVSQTDSILSFGFVGVHATQGEDRFLTVNGILCEIDDINFKLLKSGFLQEQGSKKILLFTETFDENESILDEIIRNDIKAVFSQKKIPENLKILLRRKHILLIERGGEELVKSVQLLTGAMPISDLSKLTIGDVSTMVGHFTNATAIDESRNIISLENADGCSLAYIYIRCRSFSSTGLIKKVVSNCVLLVKSVLSSPYYLPGPKLLENKLSHFLDELSAPKETISATLREIISVFINVFKEILSLYEKSPSSETSCLKQSFVLKRNAILQAVDGAINILSITHVIRKPV